MRVVTVGGPGVAEMIASPDTPGWRSFSIEFCGGTHIGRSSEPRSFVLLSEEGTGGGVRRIVGLTGDKAEAAMAEAATFAARIQAAGKLTGLDIEPEAAELARMLASAVIPADQRKIFAEAVGALKMQAVQASKEQAAELAGAAKAEAEALAAGFTPGAPFFAALLQVEADVKSVDAAVATISAVVKNVPILVLGAGKTACALAVVPDGCSIDAKEWVNAALEPCGGKGGGKPSRATGAARDPTNIAQALEAAKTYAQSKM